MTDDRVLAELMHPEVAKSIEEHGYHRGRLASAKVVRPHLEGLFPDRIADCERASLAFDTLFQDVQMQLAQGSKAS